MYAYLRYDGKVFRDENISKLSKKTGICKEKLKESLHNKKMVFGGFVEIVKKEDDNWDYYDSKKRSYGFLDDSLLERLEYMKEKYLKRDPEYYRFAIVNMIRSTLGYIEFKRFLIMSKLYNNRTQFFM